MHHVHYEGKRSPCSPRLNILPSFTRILGSPMMPKSQQEEVPENLVLYERREEHACRYLVSLPGFQKGRDIEAS
jgi:hypothetical protein